MHTPKSNCCNEPTYTDCADEGTCCYMCSKCNKSCDAMPEQKPEWEKEFEVFQKGGDKVE